MDTDVLGDLPDGVRQHALTAHADHRGSLTEIFREEWGTGVRPLQWNACVCGTRSFRGVHVHVRHEDYYVLLTGRAVVGLADVRSGGATEGASCVLALSGEDPSAVIIPRGVAHGIYFHEASVFVVGVTEYWSPEDDDFGCAWDDADLAIPWPDIQPILSARDAAAPSLAELKAQIAPWQPIGHPA